LRFDGRAVIREAEKRSRGLSIMQRLVSFRFSSTTAVLVTALGLATGFSAEVDTTATPEEIDVAEAVPLSEAPAPGCDAYGCDYAFTKPDGSTGVHTTACSADCNCPVLPGHTLFHARCYPTADGDGDDEVPVD
jgi:hypothetical protein